ncbi:MAG: DUF1643 domain-containing protein [Lachnospiraceae bacterium]|nr:DUF1643 domain-containing protein [Lachnospiraceae bacterium]
MKRFESAIKRSLVCDDDGFHCYEVCHALENFDGKKGILVTLYPSYSGLDIHKLDSTAMHLQNHMEELNLKQIRIINLFSRIVRGSRMSTRGIRLDEENMQYIEKIMQEKDFKENFFILGWGSSLSSSLVANQTKDRIIALFKKYNPTGILYQICAGNSTSSGTILHPLFLGIRFANTAWKLVPYTPPESFAPVAEKKTHIKDSNLNIHKGKNMEKINKNNLKSKENQKMSQKSLQKKG